MKNSHHKIEDSSVLNFPILLCDIHELHSGGLERMICKIGFHGKIEIVTNLKNALLRLENYETELLIIGIHVIGIHDEKEQHLEIIRNIIKKYPALKIIIISELATKIEQGIYRKMGVKGCILYGISQPDLGQVLMSVRDGEKAFDLPYEKGSKRTLSEMI
jgi:DNA-binding NarL/FixJ family response regulator